MGMQYSRGLVVGYPFENTGADIMGVNNGTVNGATFVDGQCGRALSFDGVDDYVVLPNFAFLPTADNSSWSVSCRIKIPSGTLNQYGSIAIINNWQFFANANIGTLLGFRNVNTGTSGVMCALPDRDLWHHIVFINDGGTRYIYVNTISQLLANLMGTTASVPNTISTNISTVRYKGIVDNFQIFNRALTVNEIKRLYLNLGI